MENKVAILIPTINRSDYLIRQLRYYASVGSPHPIYIGDASNNENRYRTEQVIEQLQNQITIHYHHWPEYNDRQAIAGLGKVAQESYCAFTGDDDFLVPDSLTKCAEFLNDNKEYRTAQGKGIVFEIKNGNIYGELNGVGPYGKRKNADEETGRERLLSFSKDYWVPQFSVHRTDEYCADSMYYKEIPDRGFGEIIHSFTFICKGKSKFIDCLYLIRDGHPNRGESKLSVSSNDHFDWIIGPEWNSSYKIFFKALTEALIDVDNIKKDEASIIVKQSFWIFLAKLLITRYNLVLGKSLDNSNSINSKSIYFFLKNFIKSIPGSRELASTLRLTDPLSLSAISKSSSSYNRDFMAFYNIVTKQP